MNYKIQRLFIVSILLLSIGVLSATPIYKVPNHTNSHGNNYDYPKLAMWWPTSWEPDRQTVGELARYDYIGWGYWENNKLLDSIKQINPTQKHFMSTTITEVSWDEFSEVDEADMMNALNTIPAEWFLLQEGTTIAEDIDSITTTIKLTKIKDSKGDPLFKVDETVACGWESMKVIAVDIANSSITVERGFVRAETSHKSGDKIASHITFWPESWVMNLTADCPKVTAKNSKRGDERWIDWSVDVLVPAKYKDTYDGYLQDRVEYEESWLAPEYAKSIGYDGSMEQFDSSWTAGLKEVLGKFRKSLNGKPIIANSFGMYYKELNGTVYESCPGNWSDTKEETYEDWAAGERPYVLGEEGYINVSKNGYSPNYSFVETYEYESMPDGEEKSPFGTDGWLPDFQRMRFGITTALLGDGYFSYEIATWGHGKLGLFWFDEYDNGGKEQGYLGQPKADYKVIADKGADGKVFRRDFDNGIVICNPSNVAITYKLEKEFVHIKGTQVPDINSGDTVTSVTLKPRDGVILLSKDYVAIKSSAVKKNNFSIAIDSKTVNLKNVDSFKFATIYSLNGRKLLSESINGNGGTVKIDRSNISAGSYILTLSGKNSFSEKILLR